MHENHLNQLILGAVVAASAEGHSVVALDTIFVNVNGKEKIADYETVEAVVKQLCDEQKLYQNGNGYSTVKAKHSDKNNVSKFY